MKQQIKNIIKRYYEWKTRNNKGHAILMPDFNRILPINNMIENDCRLKFLKSKNEYTYFDFENFEYEKNRSKIEHIKENYNNQFDDIDFYVVTGIKRNDFNQHVALDIAQRKNIKTVYLDHGTQGTIHRYIEFDRTKNFDYYYATNTEVKNYLKKVTQKAEILEWYKSNNIKKRKSRNIILYAPQFMSKYRFTELYPNVLQYKHRRKILEYLNELSEIYNLKVIYKTTKDLEIFDPAPFIISKFNNKNFIYENKNIFSNLVAKANWFITDCISTTFYDAIEYNTPSISLVFDKTVKIRESVLDQFKHNIFVYDDIKKVEFKLQEFITGWNHIPQIEHNPDKFVWEK